MRLPGIENREVHIGLDGSILEGILDLPHNPRGIVLFIHGSGSSRHSPRNQFVARLFNEGGLATLLFDLLTPAEEQVDQVTRHLRFDIDFLSQRTVGVTDWIARQLGIQDLHLGYYGARNGAAAALRATAERPQISRAVVSRGGRPDMAGEALAQIDVPVLLLVGELDRTVIDLNKAALAQMKPEPDKRLALIPGATHLFEEPGTLEAAAQRAREWFIEYLV